MSELEQTKEEMAVKRLLKQRFAGSPIACPSEICSTPHLDDDALNSFVEGRLSERELAPLVSHLSECGVCRSSSAQLLRLAAEVSEEDLPRTVQIREPGRFRRFMEDLVAKVMTRDEGAVMAYHIEEDETAPTESESKPEANSPESSKSEKE